MRTATLPISALTLTAILAGLAPAATADIIHATGVEDFVQGRTRAGLAVDPSRSDPARALGVPQDYESSDFVSLGMGGELVLSFGQRFGGAVRVIESTFGSSDFRSGYPEAVEVFVGRGPSGRSASYWSAGTILNTFDGNWVSLEHANILSGYDSYDYMVLIDRTLNLTPRTSADGYDVDGVDAYAVPAPGGIAGLLMACAAGARRRRR